VLDIILNNGSITPKFSAGGTCGNVLSGLSFLGWDSLSVARMGEDLAGKMLIENLRQNGVNITYITKEKKLKTARIIERLKSNGKYAKHNFLLRCPSCGNYLPSFRNPKLDAIDDIIGAEKTPDVFFFDRVTPSTLKLAETYRQAGALVFFEPNNLRHLDEIMKALSLSHIVKYAGSGKYPTFQDPQYDNLLGHFKFEKPNLIIQTLGSYGLLFRNKKNSKWQHRESLKINALYDTCGAGDWCTVGFLFYLHKLSKNNKINMVDALKSNTLINNALKFAQILAALSCSFVGAQGLAQAMDRDKILNKVRSHLNKTTAIELKPKNIEQNNKIGSDKLRLSNNDKSCPTCLLML